MPIINLRQIAYLYQQNYNTNQGQYNIYWLLLLSAIVIIIVIYFFIKRFTNSHRHSSKTTTIGDEPTILIDTETSLLITIYSLGVGLTKIASGTLQNYNYSLFITTEINMLAEDTKDNSTEAEEEGSVEASIDNALDFDKYDKWESGGLGKLHYSGNDYTKAPVDFGLLRSPINQILLKIDIPVKSTVHIAGFSLQDPVFKKLLGNTNISYLMTDVKLEGDFPDYFKIFCDKNKDVEIREVLDPTSMEYLKDFCKLLNWELFENNLYFVQSATNPNNVETNAGILKAAEDFAIKILPTLDRMQAVSSKD